MPEPLRSQMLFGDFSAGNTEDEEWQLLPTEWVRLAMERWRDRGRFSPQTHIGVDVARSGKDQTVLAVRHGLWVAPLKVHPGSATPDGNIIAALILEAMETKSVTINIDVIGVGSSPFDILNKHHYNVNGLNSAEKTEATDSTGVLTFANKRAQWWWNFRELLNPHQGEQIQLPDDPELLADLTSPRWERTTRGQIKVESKEEVIKRLGRSPDRGDAVIYSFSKVSPEYDLEWLKNI